MKLLAIDFGIKRLGFAVGNTMINSAVPIKQMPRKSLQLDLETIRNIIAEYDIEKIIIGYPLNMDGSKSKITASVENFSNYLKNNLDVAIEHLDERLTSFVAEEKLKSLYKDFRKRKESLDSVSALVILEEYMEKK